MIHSLIPTEHYLLVVDNSDIKEGDYYLRYKNSVLRCTELKESFNEALNKNETVILADGCGDPYERSKDYIKKIIAHLPLNDSTILDGVDLLPPLDDVEKLALNQFPRDEDWRVNSDNADKRPIWMDGYNKAKEKFKYTEEDMRFIIMKSFLLGVDRAQYSKEREDEIIQSLSQSKMPTHFQVLYDIDILLSEGKVYLMTTINSQGQTVLVGKYIY